MSRYSADRVMKEGFATIELSDALSGSVADIVSDVGNNLFRFESKGRQAIMPPPSLSELKRQPFGYSEYGTPILFPPNRVKNGTFTYKGQEYRLPLNERSLYHLHGEIGARPWEVTEFGASEATGAFVTSRFKYEAHPDMLAYFPHRLTFTITYRLFDGQLHALGSIVNEGELVSPFAFGFHPYFHLPSEEEGITVRIPAVAEWPVTNEAFVKGEPSVTPFSEQLNDGLPFADYPKQGCSLLSLHEEADHTCYISMSNERYTIAYRFDHQFPFVVLFRPDWASAVSLEPYTCVTDGFNLPYDHRLTGVRGIAPGEEIGFATSLWIEDEAFSK
ncbi:aldose 1-epimerase [Cohnella soli]|uniref:Aldose 1-epimerase n=1 Tax=Cohnella soli TaxID=425005 RepID=A0ABW0HYP2_9BACL